MSRVEIPFNGPAYKSEALIMSGQECINMYLRPYPENGENKLALFGTPGLEYWDTPLADQKVRGMLSIGPQATPSLIVVSGNKVFQYMWDGTDAEIGEVLTSSGPIGMASNGNDVIIVDGSYGYVFNILSTVFIQIADPDFPGGDCVIQVDGYYLVNKPGTGQIWRSDWNDGMSWGGLAFSTAGGDSDNVVGLLAVNRDIWVIGEYTVEIWYNTGTGEMNFGRIEGAFIEIGGVSPKAICSANNAVYWLGQDKFGNGQVFQAVGHQPTVISTLAIDYQISQYSTLSDAFMFSYQQIGHTHMVLTFPSVGKTWVYDSVTGYWHQRSSWIGGDFGRWRANCHAMFLGEHIIGDYANGKLYKMKTDVYDEGGQPLVAVRTTSVIRKNQNRITVDSVQVLTEPGVGLVTGDPEDVNPMMLFSWSRDGGRTWSAEADSPLSLGTIGETTETPTIYQLGQGVNWVFRAKISAKVKRVILGAFAEFEQDE